MLCLARMSVCLIEKCTVSALFHVLEILLTRMLPSPQNQVWLEKHATLISMCFLFSLSLPLVPGMSSFNKKIYFRARFRFSSNTPWFIDTFLHNLAYYKQKGWHYLCNNFSFSHPPAESSLSGICEYGGQESHRSSLNKDSASHCLRRPSVGWYWCLGICPIIWQTHCGSSGVLLSPGEISVSLPPGHRFERRWLMRRRFYKRQTLSRLIPRACSFRIRQQLTAQCSDEKRQRMRDLAVLCLQCSSPLFQSRTWEDRLCSQCIGEAIGQVLQLHLLKLLL